VTHDMSSPFDIHPEMAELIEAKQTIPATQDADELRTAWNTYGNHLSRPYPDGMVVEDTAFSVTTPQPHEIALRIYRPRGVAYPSPCVLYLHGGGFVKGSLDSGDTVAWGVAEQTEAVVVSVDYRLAPEQPFPAALDDCYATLTHVAGCAASLRVDASRIAVWGDSAGGNLAAALCLMTRDRVGLPLVAQALNYPCLTDELVSPSYRDYATSPGLTSASMDRNWSLYLAGVRPTTNAYAAPLKAPDLSGLPPAHIHIAEVDPLADDGKDYAQRLRSAGNIAELRVARRMIHGFLRARFSGPDSATEFAQPCKFLKRLLIGGGG
jgi:acetyl esterase